MNTKNSFHISKEKLLYLLIPIFSLLLAYLLLGVYNADLSMPIHYSNDALLQAFVSKTLVDNPWHTTNAYTGMPQGTDLNDFPMGNDNFHLLIIKIITLFTSNSFLAMNIFFILTFPFTSITSFYALRQLQIQNSVSAIIALLYTFLPYHFFRSTGHLMLSAYYLIPLGIVIIIWISENKRLWLIQDKINDNTFKWTLNKHKKDILILLLFCILIGSGGLYYAFYLILLILLTGFFTSVYYKNYTPIINTILIISAITIVLIINLLPYILNNIYLGKNEAIIRHFSESDTFSFRLMQLILPVQNHRLSFLSNLTREYDHYSSLINENSWSTLGLIGSIGFLISIIVCLLGFSLKRESTLSKNLFLFSSLSVFSLLYGSFGGFGTLFSFFINPAIRSNNRLSIFIAFFSLSIVGMILDRYLKKIKNPDIKLLILLSILCVGILDQTTTSFKINQDYFKNSFLSDKSFVEEIERQEGNKNKIFQLPYFSFPEGSSVNQIRGYEMFKGYLHSKGSMWSFGAMKGRKNDNWLKTVSYFKPQKMLSYIKDKGFTGLYIDRNGYKDRGAFLETQLTSILGQPLVSQDNRLVYYSLKKYKALPVDYFKLDFEKDTLLIDFSVNGNCPSYINTQEWHHAENDFRWSKEKEVTILVDPITSKTDLNMHLEIQPLIFGEITQQIIKITINKKYIGEIVANSSGGYDVSIPSDLLTENRPNIIKLQFPNATTPKKLGINPDLRTLGVGFRKIILTKKNIMTPQ